MYIGSIEESFLHDSEADASELLENVTGNS